jgi:hypothetical protein
LEELSETKLNDLGLLQIITDLSFYLNEEIEFKIFFEVVEKTPGLVFISEENNNCIFFFKIIDCYTDNQSNGTRLWLPCQDDITNLYTWEFQINTTSGIFSLTSRIHGNLYR